jgi:chromosome segregation ATPase
MKFTKVAIILLALFAVSLQAPWDHYLTNINLSAEPVKEEWVSPCVTGYRDCGYNGDTTQWCAGDYKFNILKGFITPTQGASSNIRAYRIPKGYTVRYKGAFVDSLIAGNTDPVVLAQTKDLKNGAQPEGATNTSDQVCPTMHPNWKLLVFVTESKYVQITRLMPDFLAALMRVQGSRFQKGEYGRKVNSCRAEADGLAGEITSLDTSISTLERTKNEYESTLTVLRARFETYSNIVSGTITADQWIGTVSKYKDTNAELARDVEALATQIAKLMEQINDINVRITAQLTLKGQLGNSIVGLKTQITAADAELVKETASLRAAEGEQAIRNTNYGTLVGAITNIETEKVDVTEKIRLLKLRLDELNASLELHNGKKVKLQDEMGKGVLAQKKLNEKLAEVRHTKQSLIDTVRTNENKIIEINTSVNRDNESIVVIVNKIKELDGQKNEKSAQISRYTSYATSQTKVYYQELISKTTFEISTITTKVTEVSTKISTSRTTVSTKRNTKDEKSNCVASNDKLRTQYRTAAATQGGDVEAVFNKIKALYDKSLTPLRETIDMVDDDTPVANWIVKAKTNMHSYLDNLPENPEVQEQGLEEFNRRRRRRMRRRRMI